MSKDENLTKAHGRFLESQLIRLAREAGAVTLANLTVPEVPRLPEADRSDMAFFIEQLQTVLPILGFDLFRSVKRDGAGVGTADGSPIFELKTVGIEASAREDDSGFVILSGSTARLEGTSTFPRGYRGFRDQLIADGKLVETDVSGVYRFVTDVACPSPTAAAAIVLARAAGGPETWIVRGSGETYGEWRAVNLGAQGKAA